MFNPGADWLLDVPAKCSRPRGNTEKRPVAEAERELLAAIELVDEAQLLAARIRAITSGWPPIPDQNRTGSLVMMCLARTPSRADRIAGSPLYGAAEHDDGIGHRVSRLKSIQHVIDGPVIADPSAAPRDGLDSAQ